MTGPTARLSNYVCLPASCLYNNTPPPPSFLNHTYPHTPTNTHSHKHSSYANIANPFIRFYVSKPNCYCKNSWSQGQMRKTWSHFNILFYEFPVKQNKRYWMPQLAKGNEPNSSVSKHNNYLISSRMGKYYFFQPLKKANTYDVSHILAQTYFIRMNCNKQTTVLRQS